MAFLEEMDEFNEGDVKNEARAPSAPTPTRRRSSVASVSKPTQKAKGKKKQKQKANLDKLAAAVEAAADAPVPPSLAPPMLASRPLLVCSVGNPGTQYANTLHSAGHTVLNRLADCLGYPGFHKEKTYGNGLLSKPPFAGESGNWTLWQSTSYMNESGKGVRAAYMAWAKTIEGEGRLVIVHDELEKPLGAVSLRTAQGASAKGHNGLKSIMSVMGKTPFVRIGVGIGRPVSRSSDDVARYVLKKMDQGQKGAIEGSVEGVVAKLRELESD